MTLLRLTIVPLLILQLTACSELQQLHRQLQATAGEQAPVIEGSHAVDGWLADIHWLRDSRQQQSALLKAREKAFGASPKLNNRIQLVLLLVTGSGEVRDEKRARLLLEGIDPMPANISEQSFIRMLKQFLTAQARNDLKLNLLWKQVTTQNRRIVELEQQLQALTNIEQNIQQRDPLSVTENGKK